MTTVLAFSFLTSVVLLAALALLVKDFSRFLWRRLTRSELPQQFVDLGPYAVTLLYSLVVGALGLTIYKFMIVLVSFGLSSDLLAFYRILRGVFTLVVEEQNPLAPSHFISGLLLVPCLLLLTVYWMYNATEWFMRQVNIMYGHAVYTEADVILYGFYSTMFFVLVDILLYSQDIPAVSAIAHLVYLSLSKLSALVFFLIVSHMRQLKNSQYSDSLPNHVHMSKMLKRIVYSPYLIIVVAYLIALILHLPFYAGTQFMKNNNVVLTILMVTCVLAFIVLRITFSGTFNYLGVIMISEGAKTMISQKPMISPRMTNRLLVCGLLVSGLLLFFKLRYLVFFVTLTAILLLLLVIFTVIVYGIGLAFSFTRCWSCGLSIPTIRVNLIKRYAKVVTLAGVGPLIQCSVIVLIGFGLITLFPKRIEYDNDDFATAIIGKDGKLLYAKSAEQKVASIYLPSGKIPSFLQTCLLNQEDRSFLNQRDWIPNLSNWHGFSFAASYRFLTGGGGSNINQQLVKNMVHEGKRIQDLQRKFAELIAAYQLSVGTSERAIFSMYMNFVPFNGMNEFKGILAASLKTFGRHPEQLNKLEMMYLIATIKRAKDFKVKGGYIKYSEAPQHIAEIKRQLISTASNWRSAGLLSRAELNELKNQTFDFTTNKFKSKNSGSTNEYYKSIHDSEGFDGTIISSIAQKKQSKLLQTARRFERKHVGSNGYSLYSSCIVVNVQSGSILAHYGGSGAVDLASFGSGFPVGSVIKPFLFVELLEMGWEFDEINPYDGKVKGKFTPKNYNGRYSNRRLSIPEVLGPSNNAAVVNLREYEDPIELFRGVENRFVSMQVPSDPNLNLSNENRYGEFEVNYPLGSRSMTVMGIAQAYQALFNHGNFKKLTAIRDIYNCLETDGQSPNQPTEQLYQSKNADLIANALTSVMKPGGTGNHLLKYLPKSRTYYAKTGTTDKARHGYTVLTDGKTLVVAWVSYCTVNEGTLECNDSPAIPHESGSHSAGILAAKVLTEMMKE